MLSSSLIESQVALFLRFSTLAGFLRLVSLSRVCSERFLIRVQARCKRSRTRCSEQSAARLTRRAAFSPRSRRSKLTYAENEKALCFHGPLMYEAKVSSSAPSRLVLSLFCRRQRAAVPVASRSLVHTPLVWQVLKAEYWQKGSNKNGAEGPHYFVHYKGWKQTCVSPSFSPPGGATLFTDAAPAPLHLRSMHANLEGAKLMSVSVRDQVGRVGSRRAPQQVQRGGRPEAKSPHRGAARARRRRTRSPQGGRGGESQEHRHRRRARAGGTRNRERAEARTRGRRRTSCTRSDSLANCFLPRDVG